MPYYRLSHTTQRYPHSARPPVLDRVVFTIDHVHQGGAGLYSTYDVVRYLTDRKIPVTIFIQCTDPRNRCIRDNRYARKIYQLNPALVSLGAHSLSPRTSPARQRENYELIQDTIRSITGVNTQILSYHGRNAGPEAGVSYLGIKYARGIKSAWSTARFDNLLDTPVVPMHSENAAFEYTRLRNLSGFSSTIFVHSLELRNGMRQKRVFDTFIRSVVERKIQAVSYIHAMQADYSNHSSPPKPKPKPPKPKPPKPKPPVLNRNCQPLSHFINNVITQYLYKGSRDGTRGVHQVKQLQNFLNEVGFNAGIADGIFGGKTKQAVVAYQRSKGLTADGIVGRNTRYSINSYCD